MKTTFFLMLFLFAAGSFLKAQDFPAEPRERHRNDVLYEHPSIAERTYSDSTGSYVIKFTYGMFSPYEAVGEEEGELRYSAFIEVFRVQNSDRDIIGHGFMGTYAPKGCIYDEADYLISEAKKIEMRASAR